MSRYHWLSLNIFKTNERLPLQCKNFVLLCLAFSFSSVSVDIYSPVDLICLANGSHICFSQSSSFTCGCYKDIEVHLVFWRFSNWPQFWESKIVRIINVYSAFSTRKYLIAKKGYLNDEFLVLTFQSYCTFLGQDTFVNKVD